MFTGLIILGAPLPQHPLLVVAVAVFATLALSLGACALVAAQFDCHDEAWCAYEGGGGEDGLERGLDLSMGILRTLGILSGATTSECPRQTAG